jgi:hypothetical protein
MESLTLPSLNNGITGSEEGERESKLREMKAVHVRADEREEFDLLRLDVVVYSDIEGQG